MSWFATLRGKGDTTHPALKFLEPDEHPRWIMPATGGLHPLTMLVLGVASIAGILLTETLPWVQITLISTVVFLAVALLTATRYRLLVVNEYEVIVMRTKALRTTTPVERLGAFDRVHPFEVRGSMWGQIVVGSEKLWVHRRFHKELHEADEELGKLSPLPDTDTSASDADADSGAAASDDAASGTAKKDKDAANKDAAKATKKQSGKPNRRAAEAASAYHRANRAKKRVKYAKRGGRR